MTDTILDKATRQRVLERIAEDMVARWFDHSDDRATPIDFVILALDSSQTDDDLVRRLAD